MVLGCGFLDSLKLAAIGVARVRPFDETGWLRRLLGKGFPEIVVRVKPFGSRIVISTRRIDHPIVFEEIFVEKVYDFRRLPFAPDAVVDCGAHIGLFTVKVAEAFPSARILAFEPEPNNARLLRMQVAMNGWDVDVREAALSDWAGNAVFHGEGFGGRLTLGGEVGSICHAVSVRDIRDVLAEVRADRLLVKMDVEGEEKRLIPALLPILPPIAALWFEWHHGDEDWKGIRRCLQGAGFEVKVVRATENPATRYPYLDVSAVRRERSTR